MADQRWSDIYLVFTKILCGRNFCVWQVTKLKFTGLLEMASLSLYPKSETNLVSNRNVIELLLQLKSAKALGKNYIRVKAHLVRHLLRNRLLKCYQCPCQCFNFCVSLSDAFDISLSYFCLSTKLCNFKT